MGESIGDVAAYAVAVGLSPVPLLSVAAILGSRQGIIKAAAWVVGWILGLSLLTVIGVWVFPSASAGEDHLWLGWLDLVIGVAAILLAVAMWRARSVPGVDSLPPWMAAIDALTVTRSGVVGFVLSAANPKVISITLAAVANLPAGAGGSGGTMGALAGFVIIASAGAGLLLLGTAIAAERAGPALLWLRTATATKGHLLLAPVFLLLGGGLVREAWIILR